MTLKTIAAVTIAACVAAPALATGKMTCDAPKAQWKPKDQLEQTLAKQGWQVRKSKVDGGCYEVYGTTPEGDRVEAYFHPVTFEKLFVSRRGEVLFKKAQ
jgi:hypothetical protein